MKFWLEDAEVEEERIVLDQLHREAFVVLWNILKNNLKIRIPISCILSMINS